MRKRLHDEYTRVGTIGRNFELLVGPRKVQVAMLPDGTDVLKRETFTLDTVYAELVREVYERGLANKPLW